MPLIKPKPGARIGEEDPVCAVKTVADLTNSDYQGMEKSKTIGGKWFQSRNMTELLSHCKDKDPNTRQQGDPGTGEDSPLPDDTKKKHGGPVWSTMKHQ